LFLDSQDLMDASNRARRIEGDCHTRRLASVGVNPVVQPTREHHEESGLRPDSKRLAIRVSWSGYGFRGRARIQEFEYATEGPFGNLYSGGDVIDA
jgi:hypothetical protein